MDEPDDALHSAIARLRGFCYDDPKASVDLSRLVNAYRVAAGKDAEPEPPARPVNPIRFILLDHANGDVQNLYVDADGFVRLTGEEQ